MPDGSQKKLREERAEKSRKEAAEADGLEDAEKTISFGTSDGNSKAAAPSKPALRKGIKEKIKTFKHELVVEVKIKVNYTKGKMKCGSRSAIVWGEPWILFERLSWRENLTWPSWGRKSGSPR